MRKTARLRKSRGPHRWGDPNFGGGAHLPARGCARASFLIPCSFAGARPGSETNSFKNVPLPFGFSSPLEAALAETPVRTRFDQELAPMTRRHQAFACAEEPGPIAVITSDGP
jgi:hypothetical protein